MEQVSWSAEAEADLAAIGEYIATENPDAAWRVICEIIEQAEFLAKFPKLRPIYRVENGIEIRATRSGKYRMFYTVRANSEIYILKIWHGAREEPDFSRL